MNNSLKDQLLKSGVASKQQVHKAKQDKHKKRKEQSKNKDTVDESKSKIRQAEKEKAERDRELNKKKDEQARKKAISAEINQLIHTHRIHRDEKCEVIYNFTHDNKVKRIYINDEMKQKIMQGKLEIVRIEGQYELVPVAISEKIRQRNEMRVATINVQEQVNDENDPYADYKIPDDLMW